MTPDQFRHILADALEGAAERLRENSGPDAEPVVNNSLPVEQMPLAEVTTHVLNVEEVADLLGISRGRAYESIRTGEIPALRVGSRLLVPTNALRRWLMSAGPANVRSD